MWVLDRPDTRMHRLAVTVASWAHRPRLSRLGLVVMGVADLAHHPWGADGVFALPRLAVAGAPILVTLLGAALLPWEAHGGRVP